MQEIVNHPQWELVEEALQEKMNEMQLDFPSQSSYKEIAIHCLANKKAYNLLMDFLVEAGYLKEQKETKAQPRDMS